MVQQPTPELPEPTILSPQVAPRDPFIQPSVPAPNLIQPTNISANLSRITQSLQSIYSRKRQEEAQKDREAYASLLGAPDEVVSGLVDILDKLPEGTSEGAQAKAVNDFLEASGLPRVDHKLAALEALAERKGRSDAAVLSGAIKANTFTGLDSAGEEGFQDLLNSTRAASLEDSLFKSPTARNKYNAVIGAASAQLQQELIDRRAQEAAKQTRRGAVAAVRGGDGPLRGLTALTLATSEALPEIQGLEIPEIVERKAFISGADQLNIYADAVITEVESETDPQLARIALTRALAVRLKNGASLDDDNTPPEIAQAIAKLERDLLTREDRFFSRQREKRTDARTDLSFELQGIVGPAARAAIEQGQDPRAAVTAALADFAVPGSIAEHLSTDEITGIVGQSVDEQIRRITDNNLNTSRNLEQLARDGILEALAADDVELAKEIASNSNDPDIHQFVIDQIDGAFARAVQSTENRQLEQELSAARGIANQTDREFQTVVEIINRYRTARDRLKSEPDENKIRSELTIAHQAARAQLEELNLQRAQRQQVSRQRGRQIFDLVKKGQFQEARALREQSSLEQLLRREDEEKIDSALLDSEHFSIRLETGLHTEAFRDFEQFVVGTEFFENLLPTEQTNLFRTVKKDIALEVRARIAELREQGLQTISIEELVSISHDISDENLKKHLGEETPTEFIGRQVDVRVQDRVKIAAQQAIQTGETDNIALATEEGLLRLFGQLPEGGAPAPQARLLSTVADHIEGGFFSSSAADVADAAFDSFISSDSQRFRNASVAALIQIGQVTPEQFKAGRVSIIREFSSGPRFFGVGQTSESVAGTILELTTNSDLSASAVEDFLAKVDQGLQSANSSVDLITSKVTKSFKLGDHRVRAHYLPNPSGSTTVRRIQLELLTPIPDIQVGPSMALHPAFFARDLTPAEKKRFTALSGLEATQANISRAIELGRAYQD